MWKGVFHPLDLTTLVRETRTSEEGPRGSGDEEEGNQEWVEEGRGTLDKEGRGSKEWSWG